MLCEECDVRVAHTLSQVWLLWSILLHGNVIRYQWAALALALSPLPHPEAGPGTPGRAQTQPATSGLARMKRSGRQ